MMIQAAKDSGAHMIDCVERCEEAGHEVFLSRVSVCTLFSILSMLLPATSSDLVPNSRIKPLFFTSAKSYRLIIVVSMKITSLCVSHNQSIG
jgi:hypothetical protein